MLLIVGRGRADFVSAETEREMGEVVGEFDEPRSRRDVVESIRPVGKDASWEREEGRGRGEFVR